MKLEQVRKAFKKNHHSDGFKNSCYDHIIEEIYNIMLDMKTKKYNKQWDSYYDDEKDIWLEAPCQYEDCEYCNNRPVKPSLCKISKNQSKRQRGL